MTAAYGRSPCYAQLYFYDVDTAIKYFNNVHILSQLQFKFIMVEFRPLGDH